MPFEHYLTTKPRFASEFGFQSFPLDVSDYTVPEDCNVTSYVMEHHHPHALALHVLPYNLLLPKLVLIPLSTFDPYDTPITYNLSKKWCR